MLAPEELLEPISPQTPCGQDLTYDPSFQLLETELRGKPETQFSAAEEPVWPTVYNHAVELFQRSKDLRVGVALTLAALQIDGLPGFRQGLAVIHGLVDRYWETVYPLLDKEEDNDPLERINILSGLVTPIGSFEDPLRFLQRLRKAPLCRSSRLGSFNLAQISGDAPEEGQPPPPTAAQVQGAFRDTDPALLGSIHSAVTESIQTVKAISDTVERHVGSGFGIDWAPLLSLLSQIEKNVAPFGEVTSAPEVANEEVTMANDLKLIPPGTIRSREDVVQMLDKICEFYQRTEPSSPVPMLLRRAQRLAGKDFIEIVRDLSPDALNALKIIAGEELN